MPHRVIALHEFLPYLVEAFANNLILKTDLEKRYTRNETLYYAKAAQSEYFNHYNYDRGDIQKSILCRKVLGLLMAEEDLSYLARKAWPQIYKYLNHSNDVFCLDQFVVHFRSPAIGLISLEMSNAEFTSVLCIALYLAYIRQRPLDAGVIGGEFFNGLASLELLNQGINAEESVLLGLTPEMRQRLETALQAIEKSLGQRIERYQALERFNSPTDFSYELVMVTEKLDSSELGLHIPHSREDFLICLAYLIDFEQAPEKDLNDITMLSERLIAAMRIKILAKAYRQLKQLYFTNAKETLYDVIRQLEEEIKEIKLIATQRQNEIKSLRNDYRNNLERQISSQQREIKQLQDEITKLKSSSQELFALRDFAFAQTKAESQEEEEEIILPDIRCLVVGGHRNWQVKLREIVPRSFTFIPAEASSFALDILKNVDLVLINTSFVSHKLYYRVIENLPTTAKLAYLSTVSIEFTLQELQKIINTLS